MNDVLVKMTDITKTFPGVLALNKAKFELKKGEVHALIGENGAGKSTLMKVLTGVYMKDSGEITIKGKDRECHNTREAEELGIGTIYQEFNLFPHLTVAQNIFIKRESKKLFGIVIDDKKMNVDAVKMFEKIHIQIDPTRKVENLSVAEQQMLEIVKAISFESDVIIMDEPTAALTESEIDALFEVIKKLKSRGVGIIYISHRLQELKEIADRVTVMRDGNYINTVNYSETTIPELINMMVGRSIQNIFPKRKEVIKDEEVLKVESLNRKGLLHDINFNAKTGEVLGVAGLMGSGRTEMARAVFGADPIDSGKVYLYKEEVKINSPNDAIKNGIGYLTEDRKKNGLALNLNISSNIILSSISDFTNKLGKVNDKKVNAESMNLVKKLKIKTPSLEQRVKYLSGGNQQKVIISRWLCKHSQVLIFDEPTRGIDVGAKLEVYTLINQLAENGKAIIIISSELPEILGMCDRILVMHNGKISGELSREEATENKIMHLATGSK